MSKDDSRAAASTLHPLRWRHALWLVILPVAFPLAAEARGVAEAQLEPGFGAQPAWSAPSASPSGEAPRASRDKGFYWDAPAAQIPAVILWDESGSVRRTGPGQSNTRSSGAAITASRG